MAQRAIIHPSVPREARGIEDGRSARLRGMRRLKVDVFSPLAMTFFTGDAQAVTAGGKHRPPPPFGGERRGVAPPTTRPQEAAQDDLPHPKTRALYPPLPSGPPGEPPIQQE